MTRGEHGSVIVRGDERVAVAAYPVDKVVDTTGAVKHFIGNAA